jgi:HlyD family secretion protein
VSRTQLGLRLSIPAVLLAVVGAALYGYMTAGAAVPSVTTARVTRGDIVQGVAASGTLEAVTTVQVGTQVSGTVADLLADFNDIVRKGQVLARLDPSLLHAQVDQADAGLVRANADADRLRVSVEDARIKLARATTLSERSLIAAADLEAATYNVRTAQAQLKSGDAQVTQARASVNQSRVNLDHTVITSPIDGVVIARNVDAGQTVAASMSAPTLFVLAADLTHMRVNAKLDESDIGRVKEGMEVSFHVDAYPGDMFTGRVSQVRLQGEIVSNVVTYLTVIDVANPDLRLKPGMTANVTVQVAKSAQALRVPNLALRLRPTAEQLAALGLAAGTPTGSKGTGKGTKVASVWRAVGKTFERVPVQVGLTDGSFTEVLGGPLKEGDTVATVIAAAGAATTRTTTANPLTGTGTRGGPGTR